MSLLKQIADIWMSLYSIHTLEISLFVVLVWFIDKLFHLETKLRYLLWILALSKIFIPPMIWLPDKIQDSMPSTFALMPIISTIQESSGYAAPISISETLFGIWLISVFILTLLVAHKNLLIRLYLRDANPVKTPTGIQDAKEDHRLQIFETSMLHTPILIGFREPKLYLPHDWRNWSQEQLRSIMAHEKAHLLNRDIWVLFLQYLGLILFGINPFVWLVHKRLNQLREMRCDEAVIEQVGISPVKYSKFIVKFMEEQSKNAVPMLIGKCFSKKTKSMFRRINHLLNLEEANMKTRNVFQFVLPAVLAILILPFSWRCSDNESLPIAQSNPQKTELNKVAEYQESTSSDEKMLSISKSDDVVFVPYDQPPKPVGGFAAIVNNLKYPELARKAGIEGKVIVQICIDVDGEIVDTKILKNIGDGQNGCGEAAINALKGVKWTPGLKDGQPVKVWVAVRVVFKLS
ncbi:MAG: M56 family metallopeptidase [bacterium]